MDAERLANVAYSMIVDDAGPLADRAEVRKRLDDALAVRLPLRSGSVDRDKWGTSREAVDGTRAMENMFGSDK